MSVSKVQFDGNDLINLESDTVTAENLRRGYTAHDANGDTITGTFDGIVPSGNKEITATTSTQTGIDVSSYATVSVNHTPYENKSLWLSSTTPQTVYPSSGKLLLDVTPVIDTSVIKAENIAKDVQILGVTGTHEGGGGLYNGASGEDLFPNTTTNHTITFPATTPSTSLYERMFARSRGGYSDIIVPCTAMSANAFQYFAQYGHIKSFTADNITRFTTGHEFYYAFQYSTIEKISFKNLTTIGASYGFYHAADQSSASTTLKEIDFSSLQSITGTGSTFAYAFQRCKGIYPNKVAHPFPVLETISSNSSVFGYTFQYGRATMYVFDKLTGIGIASSGAYSFLEAFSYNTWDYRDGDTDGRKCGVAFPLVTQVGYSSSATAIYANCKYLTRGGTNNCALYMTSLDTIYNSNTTNTNGQFAYCNAKYIYMPNLPTIEGAEPEYTFYGSTDTTELHFGIENQATIEATTGYSSKFGATAATVYFDLANHLTIDGVVYDRDGNTDDYDEWYFGFTNGSTTYYIDNYTGNVGDTVYTKSGDTYTATALTVTAIA